MTIHEDAATARALLDMAVAEVTAASGADELAEDRERRRATYHRAARVLMDRVAAEVLTVQSIGADADGSAVARVRAAMPCDHPECATLPVYVCTCQRCAREPDDEKFYACTAHTVEVATKHVRIRGRQVEWKFMGRMDAPV